MIVFSREQNHTEQNGTEQNGTKQKETEQNKTERNRTEQNGTERNGTEKIILKSRNTPSPIYITLIQTAMKSCTTLKDWVNCKESQRFDLVFYFFVALDIYVHTALFLAVVQTFSFIIAPACFGLL